MTSEQSATPSADPPGETPADVTTPPAASAPGPTDGDAADPGGAAASAITLDEVLAEARTWLGKERISIDWVNQVDTLLSDLVDDIVTTSGGWSPQKLVRAILPTTVEYAIELANVGAGHRLRLLAGKRTIREMVVRPGWHTAAGLPADDRDVRIRACAAAVVTMLASLLKRPPVTLHGLTDPEVLFVLNEASAGGHSRPVRAKLIARAAAMEPTNRLVRFAVLQQELRAEDAVSKRDAYRILLPAFDALAKEAAMDPAFAARAKYSAAVCLAHVGGHKELEDAHERLRKLLDDLAAADMPARFGERFSPVVRTAIACTCQEYGSKQGRESLEGAVKYGSDPRAMYNLACAYNLRHRTTQSKDDQSTAAAYLRAALRADPSLELLSTSDPMLVEIAKRPEDDEQRAVL